MGIDRAALFRMATSEPLERVVKAAPGGEAAAWRVASRYVAGRSHAEALSTAASLLDGGHGVSVDLFGELVRDPAAAERVVEDYQALAVALPPAPADVRLSVDLTHLALDSDPAGAADRLAAITQMLPGGRRAQVGAEDAARTEAVLGCVLDVAGRGLADRLGATVQANLLRAPGDADALVASGVHVRLVKGAYVELPVRIRTVSPPTLPTCGWGSASPKPARPGRWRPTTVGCARRCCSHSGRCRSSTCSACALRSSISCATAIFPPGCMSPTAPTGSATGSAASPNGA